MEIHDFSKFSVYEVFHIACVDRALRIQECALVSTRSTSKSYTKLPMSAHTLAIPPNPPYFPKMKLITFFSISLFFVLSSQAQSQQATYDMIDKLMAEQQACWNNGDLDGFMAFYWKSDQLKFIGKNGVTYGWENTAANYRKSYPGKEKMGELHFDIISHEEMGDNFIMTVGKWQLNYENEDDAPNGHFTLIWKKIDGTWKIISDHTS